MIAVKRRGRERGQNPVSGYCSHVPLGRWRFPRKLRPKATFHSMNQRNSHHLINKIMNENVNYGFPPETSYPLGNDQNFVTATMSLAPYSVSYSTTSSTATQNASYTTTSQTNLQNSNPFADLNVNNRAHHQQLGHSQLNEVNRNGLQNSHARSPTCRDRPPDSVIDSHPVDLSSPKPQRYGQMSYMNVPRDNSGAFGGYNRTGANYETEMDTSRPDYSSSRVNGEQSQQQSHHPLVAHGALSLPLLSQGRGHAPPSPMATPSPPVDERNRN
ncbi:uncharacterized protein CEXT_813051, partial [Caerostris extrusa]